MNIIITIPSTDAIIIIIIIIVVVTIVIILIIIHHLTYHPTYRLFLINLDFSFGFDVLREVTEDTVSVPDRMVWGAIGTLMELDIKQFFTEWTPKLEVLQEQADSQKIARETALFDTITPARNLEKFEKLGDIKKKN